MIMPTAEADSGSGGDVPFCANWEGRREAERLGLNMHLGELPCRRSSEWARRPSDLLPRPHPTSSMSTTRKLSNIESSVATNLPAANGLRKSTLNS